RMAELGLLGSVSSISASARLAARDFKTSIGNALNRLSNSRAALKNSYDELHEFRAEHDLRRPAHTALSRRAAGGPRAGAAAVGRRAVARARPGAEVAGVAHRQLARVRGAQAGIADWALGPREEPQLQARCWLVTSVGQAIVGVCALGAAHRRDHQVGGGDA